MLVTTHVETVVLLSKVHTFANDRGFILRGFELKNY